MQPIHGSTPPIIDRAKDEGQLSGSTPISGMSLVFRMSAVQQKNLTQLLQAQQTKGSPMYHRWLGPGQFAASYGVSASDLAKVSGWLQSQGFRVDSIPPSADRINFSGTAAQVNAAFQTQLHRYTLNGQPEWANSTNVSVPQAIAGVTATIEHLNTFRPKAHWIQRAVHAKVQDATGGLSPHYTVQDQNGNELNFIAPSDSATIYNISGLYSAGNTGKGQYIGIAGQTDITQYQSDIANFRSLSGLNASNLPAQVLVPNSGTAQAYAGDLEEADIDVEWSGAIAKDASIVYVTVGSNTNTNVFDALQYAIQTPLVNSNSQFLPVISISYGACEAAYAGTSEISALEQMFQQANAQGQTIVASSGDSGSADCDTGTNNSGQPVAASAGLAVDYPGSSQYVTAAGGTSFSGDLTDQSKYWNSTNNSDNGSALSYIPETTWNDTPNLTDLSNAGSLSASGGGASSLFSKPSWQTGPGVPGDGKRDVPDLALAADPNHDGYVLCTEETNTAETSFTGMSSCVYPVGSGQVPYFDANSQGYLYGGTSIVAPQLAGMITLWNQAAGNTQGVGNINPFLYLTVQNTPAAFHDVTTGSNAVVCVEGSPDCIPDPTTSGNYIMSCCNAGTGYDTTTGLGSVDATAMASVWPGGITAINSSFSLVSSPGAITVSPGSSAKATLLLTSHNGFAGAVTLTCSNLPADTSCSFSPNATATLSSGAVQNVTITLAATSAAQASHPLQRSWPVQAGLVSILGLSLFGLGRRKRRFPSGWMALLILACSLMGATFLTACGSSGSGGGSGPTPPANTGTVTVTATSGSTTASTQIALTIS